MQRVGWVCLGLVLMAISGCGKVDGTSATRWKNAFKNRAQKSPVVELARDGQTRLVRHAGGEDHVPLNPQRVVTLSATDAVIFLGFVPVAEAGTWNQGMPHYLDPYTKDIGHVRTAYSTRMAAAESVMTFEPDLILMDTLDGPTLNQMRKIAPTVVVSTTAWISLNSQVEQHVADVGTALGMPDRAEAALRWLRYKMELARRDLHAFFLPRHGGRMPILTVIWPFTRIIRVHLHPVLYEEGLGFTCPKAIRWSGTHASPRNKIMDAEQLADIQAEYICCVSSNYESRLPTQPSIVGQNPLWERLPAVREGRIFNVPMYLMTSDSPMAYSIFINNIVQGLLPTEHQSRELKEMLKARPDDADIADVAHWPKDRGVSSIKMTAKSHNKQSERKAKEARSPKVSKEKRKGDLP